MDDYSTFVCVSCLKSESLIRAAVSGKAQICVICRKRATKLINFEDRKVARLFRALLRFHFHEWEYNGHFGGDSIESLFLQENPIIQTGDAYGIEALTCSVFAGGYENEDVDISIHGGYDKSGLSHLLTAIEPAVVNPWCAVQNLKRNLTSKNHFEVLPELLERLNKYVDDISATISGARLFRARLGYKDVKRADVSRLQRDSMTGVQVFQPYLSNDIHAPPPLISRAGRLNRDGVSFLYLASDRNTAICEIRPHPGDYVSVGQFEQAEPEVRIADFTNLELDKFAVDDNRMFAFEFLYEINRELTMVIPPNQRTRFTLSQLLSDACRELEFRGVAYTSSVGAGKNYCFFHPADFRYVDGSHELVLVEQVSYSYDTVERITTSIESVSGF